MKRFFSLFIYILSWNVKAQSPRQIVQQKHSWGVYIGEHPMSSRWGIHAEIQVRRADLFRTSQQLLLRGGMHYFLSDDIQITAGYCFVNTSPYSPFIQGEAFDEHRAWQQVLLKQKSKQTGIHHRYRLEQRWIEQAGNTKPFFIQRVRYLCKVAHPIPKTNWQVVASNELFLGITKHIRLNILEQNRTFLGLHYFIHPHLKAEVGYLYQWILYPDGIRAERNHTIQAGIYYTGKK